MHVTSEQQQRHAGAAAATAQGKKPTSAATQGTTARPTTAPSSCAPAVVAVTAGRGEAPTSVAASTAPQRGRLSFALLQSADNQAAAPPEEVVSTEAAAPEDAKAAGESDVLATLRAGVAGDSLASPLSADAIVVAESPTRFSPAAAGRREFADSRRNVLGTECEASAVVTEGTQGATTGKKGVEIDVRKACTGTNNSGTSRRSRVRDSCDKGHTHKSCRRRSKGRLAEPDAAASDVAEDETKQSAACTEANVSAHDTVDAGDFVSRKASRVKRTDRHDFRSRKEEKRKEYQRLKACLKPSVVPLRTPVVTYPLGALPADGCTAESATSSGVSLSAGVSVATAGERPVSSVLAHDAAAIGAGPKSISDLVNADASEDGKKREVSAAAGATFACDAQIRAAAAAAAISAGAGDDEEETWRGSSRSRTSAAGGRTGRFSAAERAAVCAALRQYAIDNGLEGGTVEAAVEHLMTAQDVSSSSSEGKRKRGGRALRFAAITRWLPQRSCASIYFYIRRNLCAHIGTKKHGPWSSEEVQTLLKMESELRVSQPRSRFARIAAVLNRTASSVYDKWKEIGPRFSPLACSDTSRQDAVAHRVKASLELQSKDDRTAADAVVAAEGAVTDTHASALFSKDGTAEANAATAVCSGEAFSTMTSRKSSRVSDHPASSDTTEEAAARQLNHDVERQSREVQVQQLQQELQLLDGERSTGRGGRASGHEKQGRSGDSTTASAEEDATEEAPAKRGKESVAYEGRSDLRSRENAARSRTTSVAENSSEGQSGAELRSAGSEVRAAAFLQETNATPAVISERRGAVQLEEKQRREFEDAHGETKLMNALGKVKEAVSLGTSGIERRARFGTTEEVLQLLQAIQEQTGECLPATGISWSAVQKQLFPHISASQLRLYYTTRLVPKELAKRMGVSAAEPVLLRFVVRCLDSLLNAKQTHRGVQEGSKENMSHCSRATPLRELSDSVLASTGPQRNGRPTTWIAPRGAEGMAPAAAPESEECCEMSQLQQGTLNGQIIDTVGDVDWLEILPFCPTALPPFVFRRAVTTLSPTKSSEDERCPESLQLAQQVLLLKERLELEGSSTNAGRDAALLLRAALPREVLARAVRRELRKRRWKNVKRQQRKQRIIKRQRKAMREQHKRLEEGQRQHQVEEQPEDHENGGAGGDGEYTIPAVDGSGGSTNVVGGHISKAGADSDENTENNAVDGYDEEEEEAREQARESQLTEAELEEKWHREEKLLGRAALLAVLRKAGGKEMRRLRRRNRKCVRLKEASDGVKRMSPGASHADEIQSNCTVVTQLDSTRTPFCDAERNAVLAHPSPGHVSSCREERLVLSQLQKVPDENKTSEPLGATPLDQRNQQEQSEALAGLQQQPSQPSVVQEEQALPLLPHSDGTRARKRHRQRLRTDVSVRRLSQEEERQNTNASGEVSGTTVNDQQLQREEIGSAPGLARAVGDLDQQVQGLMRETTGTAGSGWQQLDGEIHGNTEASEQASNKRKQQKRSRIISDEVKSVETADGTADPAAQHDSEPIVLEEQPEAGHGEETHGQGNMEADRELDGTERPGGAAVSNGEEDAREGRRRRRKKKNKSVVEANPQPDDGVRPFSVDCSGGGKEQLLVRDGRSEQAVVALGLQSERKKKRKKMKKKKEIFREGLDGDLLTENEGANVQIVDASAQLDQARKLLCEGGRVSYSFALDENTSAPANQLCDLKEHKEASNGSNDAQLHQMLVGHKQDQGPAQGQQQRDQELQQMRTEQEQLQQGHYPLPCEKRRESLLQEVQHETDDGKGGQRMHSRLDKERKRKKKRKRRVEESDGIALGKKTRGSFEEFAEDTGKIHEDPVCESVEKSVAFSPSISTAAGREERETVGGRYPPPAFVVEGGKKRRKKKRLQEVVIGGD